MRTKARDGFIKALRDAHCWLDELLVDPTQTIESLAIREGKSERSIRMTLSLAFMSPALAEAAHGGGLLAGIGAGSRLFDQAGQGRPRSPADGRERPDPSQTGAAASEAAPRSSDSQSWPGLTPP